ncbi:MAG: hypothetical protein KDA89_21795, partial [Planctomycetaceae bacterium]|nr:hypothetical protein [Planctomycetaceae bacterium]
VAVGAAASLSSVASSEVLPQDPNRDCMTSAGVLTFISPETVAVDGRVRVWAEIPNHLGNLRPGMRGILIVKTGRPTDQDDDR